MNKRILSQCAGIAALSTLLTSTLFIVSAHAQADLPPPPPPIGPSPNAPQPAMPPILPPQQTTPDLAPLPTAPVLPPVAAGPTPVVVDAAKRHDISPLIYGVAPATPAQLQALNAPLVPAQVGAGLLNFRTFQPASLRRVFSEDASPDTQALRNRSTRLLWDPQYGSPSGASLKTTPAALIPGLKKRLTAYPAGTKAGLTNYSWGAEDSLGGATAQADVLGIFGREGLDLATRAVPGADTPTFKAMQMYRNYDGKNGAFGSIGVADGTPDPDTLSSFASVRRSDGALTVMVINKSQSEPASIALSVLHFSGTAVTAWQLTSANAITRLPSAVLSGGRLTTTLPAQSITLFVVAAR